MIAPPEHGMMETHIVGCKLSMHKRVNLSIAQTSGVDRFNSGGYKGGFQGNKIGAVQDIGHERPRTLLLGTSVNSAAKAYSSCPDSRMAALFFLSFRAGSGCTHSETCAGCIVSFTTPTRSSLRASRFVSSRSSAAKASRVFLISYFLL